MGHRLAAAIVAAAVLPATAVAQDQALEVRGETRLRVEAIDGQFRPDTAPSDTALLLRTSLFAEYDAGPVRIGGELLDSRAYFERRRSSIGTTEVNALEPIQAYVTAEGAQLRLQAGRFTYDLGSRRLLARNAFRNSINVFTGINAELGSTKTVQGKLFWMVAPTRLPSDRDGIQDNAIELDRERGAPTVFGGFVTRRRGGVDQELYAIRLAENDARGVLTRDRHLWTAGARLRVAPVKAKWDAEVEGAIQGGRARRSTAARDTADRRVSAGFIHASLGRTFDLGWQPRVAVAFDYASGDGRDPEDGRFDTLFGARSFDFGPTSLFGPIGRANLKSLELRGEARPDDRTDLLLAVRPAWLAARSDAFSQTGVRDPAGRSGDFAGVQIDARARRTLVRDRLRGAIGAATFLKGRFLRDAPNAPPTGDTLYGYTELTVMF